MKTVVKVKTLSVALMGSGGVGKTCTLSTLVGEEPPTKYTSTDVFGSVDVKRVASVSKPSDSLKRDVKSRGDPLWDGDKLIWLVGNKLLEVVARCADTTGDETREAVPRPDFAESDSIVKDETPKTASLPPSTSIKEPSDTSNSTEPSGTSAENGPPIVSNKKDSSPTSTEKEPPGTSVKEASDTIIDNEHTVENEASAHTDSEKASASDVTGDNTARRIAKDRLSTAASLIDSTVENEASAHTDSGKASASDVTSDNTAARRIAKDMLSTAASLIDSTEPLPEVNVINFIDSGGQLQFTEIFSTFTTSHNLQSNHQFNQINGVIHVFDISKNFAVPIIDQFYVEDESIGERYVSQCTCKQLFKRSLQALHQDDKLPRVAIVATHRDLLSDFDLQQRLDEMTEWVEGLTELKSSLIAPDDFNPVTHVLKADDPSPEDTARARQLLRNLTDMFEDGSLTTKEIPLRQFLLEQAMRTLGEENYTQHVNKVSSKERRLKGVVTLEECQEIADTLEIDAIDEAIRNLRSYNLILYYPEVESLKDVVFCEVQTLLSIITRLAQYSAKVELCTKPELPDVAFTMYNDFVTKGTVFEDLFKAPAFETSFDVNLTATRFIQLMEYLHIIGKLSENRYIMPCILREMGGADIAKQRMLAECPAKPLLLYFGSWPRSGLICSLIARLVSQFNWMPEPFHDRLHRNCISFQHDSYTVTVIESYDSGYFEVHVKNTEHFDKICPRVRQTLFEILEKAKPQDAFLCEDLNCTQKPPHAATVKDKHLWCTLTDSKERNLSDYAQLTTQHECWLGEVQQEPEIAAQEDSGSSSKILYLM